MNQVTSSSALTPDDETRIAAFEQVWRSNETPPELRSFLEVAPTGDAADCVSLLWELIAVDLEYRWQQSSRRQPINDALGWQPRLEDYRLTLQDRLPAGEWPLSLVAEEYRVRCTWGDRPHSAHYLARFPHAPAELLRALRQVDEQLQAESSLPPSERIPAGSAGAAVDPRAPLLYSDFVIERHLGAGATGKVYQARQLSLARPVAIKALLKVRQDDSQAIERFLQEARLVAQLRHPGIVGVHGVGRFPGGGYFMVLELITGESLRQRMQRAPMPVLEGVRIVGQVADAVEYAHQHGIVHCDLSPGNVLLDVAEGVYVTDFGFAQLVAPQPEEVYAVGGTLPFMAPEQLDSTIGPLIAATDVYGLGALLRWLLPHDESAATNATERALLSELNCLCQYAMQPDPASRFRSAAELSKALRGLSAPNCQESNFP